jgi:hypothetical protein
MRHLAGDALLSAGASLMLRPVPSRARPAAVAPPDCSIVPGRRGRRRRLRMVGTAVLAVVALVACTSEDRPSAAPTPRASPGPMPLQGVDDGPLRPGQYVATVAGGEDHAMLPVLSVPDGFHNAGGVGVVSGDTDEELRVVWVWDIGAVYSHPCDAGKVVQPVGPTVADLANAFAAQPMRKATDPVPVTVGGYEGLYMELSVPEGTDVTKCAGGRFDSWVEDGSTHDGRWQQIGGQIDKLWILDVDGDRLTVATAHGPSTRPDAVQELEDMASAVTFVPADRTSEDHEHT